jgi:hypothetical protein
MPTIVTKTVKASGGNYTSLAAWEAGEQGDLAGARDEIAKAEIYAFDDGGGDVDINGWTTSATQYPWLYVPPAERHNGRWSAAKQILTCQTTTPLTISELHFRAEGMQIRKSVNAHSPCISIPTTGSDAGTDIRITDCILYASLSTATYRGYGVTNSRTAGTVCVDNTIAMSYSTEATLGHGCFSNFGTGGTMYCSNCTAIGSLSGFRRTGGTLILENCYAGGSSSSSISGTVTQTHCATSDTTAEATWLQSVPYSTVTFVNVTQGSEDLSLAVGSILWGYGQRIPSTAAPRNFTTDIVEADRLADPCHWSIGAHQGTYTVPAEADVEAGVDYGEGGTEFEGSFSADFPDVSNVTTDDTVNGSAGTLELPAVGDVQAGVTFGGGGTEFTGTLELPAEADVEDGVGYGAAGTEFTGTLQLPAVGDVEDGVGYGAGGTEFTGELAATLSAEQAALIAALPLVRKLILEQLRASRVPAPTGRSGAGTPLTDTQATHLGMIAFLKQLLLDRKHRRSVP